MTGGEAVAIIQRKLGFRSDQSDAIIAELNEAMRLLEQGKTLPRFLIMEDETLQLTANVNYVDLPTDFLRLVDDDYPVYTVSPSGVRYLEEAPWDSLQKLWAISTEGEPRGFAVRTTRMYVAPTPTEDTELTWSYYSRGETIVSAGTNRWLQEDEIPFGAPYLLIGLAGRKMAGSLSSSNEIKIEFDNMVAQWRTAVFNDTVEWETAGPVIMGGDL